MSNGPQFASRSSQRTHGAPLRLLYRSSSACTASRGKRSPSPRPPAASAVNRSSRAAAEGGSLPTAASVCASKLDVSWPSTKARSPDLHEVCGGPRAAKQGSVRCHGRGEGDCTYWGL